MTLDCLPVACALALGTHSITSLSPVAAIPGVHLAEYTKINENNKDEAPIY